MPSFFFTALVVLAGAAIAFQSPINAGVAQKVGTFQATLVSFLVGTAMTVLVVLVAPGGLGALRGVRGLAWWQYAGGALGAAYVTAIIVAVPRIGVTALIVAGLFGQVLAAMLIDHYGWLGVAARPIELRRLAALPVLAFAIWLLQRR
jgi:transporter family-2 protein